jgi:transposase
MRGADTFTESLFPMKRLDDFVPTGHPLRPLREMVNKALVAMNGLFADMYEADIKGGRPSVAPEKLLRAMLLQVLYSVRSVSVRPSHLDFRFPPALSRYVST